MCSTGKAALSAAAADVGSAGGKTHNDGRQRQNDGVVRRGERHGGLKELRASRELEPARRKRRPYEKVEEQAHTVAAGSLGDVDGHPREQTRLVCAETPTCVSVSTGAQSAIAPCLIRGYRHVAQGIEEDENDPGPYSALSGHACPASTPLMNACRHVPRCSGTDLARSRPSWFRCKPTKVESR
jgi:hypothetical protein